MLSFPIINIEQRPNKRGDTFVSKPFSAAVSYIHLDSWGIELVDVFLKYTFVMCKSNFILNLKNQLGRYNCQVDLNHRQLTVMLRKRDITFAKV